MNEKKVPGRTNIREVAAAAGVSHMTVSRVMNNHPSIRPETRDRVLAEIERLNYRPNSAARALASQRYQRVGVLTSSDDEFGPARATQEFASAAQRADYAVATVTLPNDATSFQEALSQLMSQGVDCLCIVAPRLSSLQALRELRVELPVVVLGSSEEHGFPAIAVDQFLGTRLLVDHLAELGHREILHLAGPQDWLDAKARSRAFEARAKAWGLRSAPIAEGDWSADFGYDYMTSFSPIGGISAVFAANDEMALGVMHACWERGIEVPRELSVVGFDDIPMAAHFAPPLTTIRQDFRYAAERAMDILLAALDRKAPPAHDALSVELIQRHSTAAPRRDTLTK